MEEPLVSIVMSTYNRAHLLEEAVESIKSQTYKNWMLVLVDDCSKDTTKVVMAKLAAEDKRILRVFNSHNMGSIESKRRHMLEARGKYLAVLDDDDKWTPYYLRIMVEALEANPDKYGVYCNALIGINNKVIHWISSKGRPFPNILPSTMLWKSDKYKEFGGWDPWLKYYHAEGDLWIRANGREKFIGIPTQLVTIGYQEDNMSKNKLKSAIGLIQILRKHKKNVPDLAGFYLRIGVHMAESNRKYLKWLYSSFKVKPSIEVLGGILLTWFLGRKGFLRTYKLWRKLNGYV